MDYATLYPAFAAAGQEHVFRFWKDLDETARAALLADAAEVDLAELAGLNETLVRAGAAAAAFDAAGLEPAPWVPLPEHGGDAAAWANARARGEEALAAGRVAAFVVAGGQGTRLGFNGPKGTFPVTPVRRATLFQVFAEKLRAAEVRYGRQIPWLIMTSHANHAATEAFFTAHACFGLDPAQVRFFRQGRMPAVDFAGQILLETPSTLAMSPDGHGGSLRAMVRSGATAWLAERGVDVISYFQVDNPLVRVVDPAFLGFHLAGGSEMSSKMLPKAYAQEKLGHFCVRHGRMEVVEYSDLPMALQEERDAAGQLRFLAGSIAIHALDRAFVERLGGAGSRLPFHRADKKIPCVDAAGQPLKPAKPNGVKFEMFVFDALPFARHPLVLETSRAEEFSPVKNAEGVDSPATSARDQLRQWTRWAHAAGLPLPADAAGDPAFPFEITPLHADSAEALAARVAREGAPTVAAGTVLA